MNSLDPDPGRSLVPVTMTATASPNAVAPGGSVTLSNINQQLAVPPGSWSPPTTSGTLRRGSTHPGHHIQTVIAGTNTVQGNQTTNDVSRL